MWTHLRHYLGICLKGLKKTAKIFQLRQPVPRFKSEPRTSPGKKEDCFPLDSTINTDGPIPLTMSGRVQLSHKSIKFYGTAW